jgi:hypothetical protein
MYQKEWKYSENHSTSKTEKEGKEYGYSGGKSFLQATTETEV